MQKREIVARFLEAGLLVHPAVVTYISESGGFRGIFGVFYFLSFPPFVGLPKEGAGV